MTADPFKLLPEIFGDVLSRLRRERNFSVEALANVSGLPVRVLRGFEAGSFGPDLRDILHIAVGLEVPPVVLLAEVISAWRADPADYGLYKSRPSDLARLHRLGYFHDPGDFRELPRVYESLGHATADARKLNVVRINKGTVPIDTLTIYVRVGYVRVDVRSETEGPP